MQAVTTLDAPRTEPVEFTAEHHQLPFADMLSFVISRELSGTLHLEPSGVTLHFRRGILDAAQGHEPLGQILLGRGYLTEDVLSAALQGADMLGQNLIFSGILPLQHIQEALEHQAKLALASALYSAPARYTLRSSTAFLPEPRANLGGTRLLTELITRDEHLPLQSAFHIAPAFGDVHVPHEAWQLLRCCNGRRTLERAMQGSGLSPNAAREAARYLITRRLIVQSAVVGLKLIYVRLRPATSTYQPPAALRANLFLRHLDGLTDAWTVAQKLRFSLEEAATLLVSLYRDGVVDVVRGRRELELLTEEF